jgi:hypothetical protein
MMMYMSEKNVVKKFVFVPLKAMNKGVGSGTGSAPKFHGFPKLAVRSDSDL